jgi:hypothetical protein
MNKCSNFRPGLHGWEFGVFPSCVAAMMARVLRAHDVACGQHTRQLQLVAEKLGTPDHALGARDFAGLPMAGTCLGRPDGIRLMREA